MRTSCCGCVKGSNVTIGNQYILVVQDYYSKWACTMPLPDQKPDRIVQILNFTVVGRPDVLFRSGSQFCHILSELCNISLLPNTPMEDGLLVCMNRACLTSYTLIHKTRGLRRPSLSCCYTFNALQVIISHVCHQMRSSLGTAPFPNPSYSEALNPTKYSDQLEWKLRLSQQHSNRSHTTVEMRSD